MPWHHAPHTDMLQNTCKLRVRFAPHCTVCLPTGEKCTARRKASPTRDHPLQQVFALAPRVFREVRRTSEFAHHAITFQLFVAAYLLLGALNSLLAFLFVSVIFGISFGCPLLFMHIQRFKNRSVHRCFHRTVTRFCVSCTSNASKTGQCTDAFTVQSRVFAFHAHSTLQKEVSPPIHFIYMKFMCLNKSVMLDFQCSDFQCFAVSPLGLSAG